jgi:hypothetical protein
MAQRKRQCDHDSTDDDDGNEHSDDGDDEIDAFDADIMDEGTDLLSVFVGMVAASEEDDVPSHLLISLFVMMMYLFCSCFTVLHKVGSGNYDHGATTTRLMRLRLPDIAGHI